MLDGFAMAGCRGMYMRKITKALLVIAGMALIAGISYMAGTRMESRRQAQKENRWENIATIAIVNMDDGVMREGIQVNYASQLMFFPDDNFVSVGLNDARIGIQNGSYAAYIIIPESFSVSVTSIENNPRKITLECAYNPHLSEEAKIQAVQNVHNFRSAFNANISYMYIDAVLSAFHGVQDDSAKILANDTQEMKLLQSVDAAKLVAPVEHTELVMAEADIQPVELAAYTQQNRSFLTEMSEGYAEAVQKGRDGYLEIQNTNSEVAEASAQFFMTYQAIVDEAAAAQAEILKKGQENLRKDLGQYNQNIATSRDVISRQISEMVDKQLAADQNMAKEQLDEILQEIGNVKLQSKWENAYQGVQEYAEREINEQAWELTESYKDFFLCRLKTIARNSYLQGTKDALEAVQSPDFDEGYQESLEKIPEEDFVTVSGNDLNLTVSGNCLVFDASGGDALLPDYQQGSISVDWDNPKDEMGEPIQIPDAEMAGPGDYAITLAIGGECGEKATAEAVESIVQSLFLEEKEEALLAALQKEFTEPILDENLTQMERLKDSHKALGETLITYENRLFAFDPGVYLEQANLNAYLNDIAGNTENMMGAVTANNTEYASYATDADRAASHNMANLQMALNHAQMQTASNVETSIEGLIASRENMNAENVSLLEGFTGLLAYTRVQSQGNPEVYDYIVNPVVTADYSPGAGVNTKEANQEGALQKGKFLKGMGEFVLWVAIAICIAIIAVGICRKYFYQSKGNRVEEPEEIF